MRKMRTGERHNEEEIKEIKKHGKGETKKG